MLQDRFTLKCTAMDALCGRSREGMHTDHDASRVMYWLLTCSEQVFLLRCGCCLAQHFSVVRSSFPGVTRLQTKHPESHPGVHS